MQIYFSLEGGECLYAPLPQPPFKGTVYFWHDQKLLISFNPDFFKVGGCGNQFFLYLCPPLPQETDNSQARLLAGGGGEG